MIIRHSVGLDLSPAEVDVNGRFITPTGGNGGYFFGDSGSGFYESAVDQITIQNNGLGRFRFTNASFFAINANGALISSVAGSSTVPNIVISRSDLNTGLGHAGADLLSLIVGGKEIQRLDGNASSTFTSKIIGHDAGAVTQIIELAGSQTANALEINTNGGSAGDILNIDSAGDVLNVNGVYGTISDIKLKENILDGTDKLLGILKLKVRSYNFKDNPNLKLLGFVAQELEETFPGLVAEVPDYEKVLNPNWIPKPAKISQKLLTVRSRKTVTKTVDTYDSINDRYIRTSVDEIVNYDEPIVDIFDVYDEKGIKIDTKTIPAMEDYEEEPAETEADRPYITVLTGTTTKHIKTSVLIPMLVKALQEHIYTSHTSWLNTKQGKIDSFIDTIFANPFTFK